MLEFNKAQDDFMRALTKSPAHNHEFPVSGDSPQLEKVRSHSSNAEYASFHFQESIREHLEKSDKVSLEVANSAHLMNPVEILEDDDNEL